MEDGWKCYSVFIPFSRLISNSTFTERVDSHAKEKFYNNLEASISDFYSNDKKQFWSIIRHFVKNNRSTSSIPLKNGQNTYSYTDQEKADCLNDFFTSVSTINDDNCPLPTFELKCQNKLTSIVCIVLYAPQKKYSL